jgi:hypothetical protein
MVLDAAGGYSRLGDQDLEPDRTATNGGEDHEGKQDAAHGSSTLRRTRRILHNDPVQQPSRRVTSG